MGANALCFTARNADTVLLGRVVGAGDLGLYGRSCTTMVLPLRQVSQVLGRVLLPTLAQLQDDVPRLRRAWVEVLRATLAVGLPVGLGIAVTARAFVGTLFGDAWLGMVPVLVLLAASLPPQLVARDLGALYQATGRTGPQFRLALVSTGTTLVAIVAGLPWGTTGVATALLVHSGVGLAIGLVPMMRILGLSAGTLWAAARGYLVAGGALALAAAGVLPLLEGAPAPGVLAGQAAAGALAYGGVLLLVEREQVLGIVRRVVAVAGPSRGSAGE